MKTIYYNTPKDKKLHILGEVRDNCWINIDNATKEDLQEVLTFTPGLDYLDIDDSLDKFEIPRIERQEGNILIFVRNPSITPGLQYTEILTIILSKKYLITISPDTNSTISYLIENNSKLQTNDRTKLLLSILLNVAQQFSWEIKDVRNKVLKRFHQVGMIDTPDFKALALSEEILSQYLSALVPLRNVIESLITNKWVEFHEHDKDLLDDLLITLRQTADVCKVSQESIKSTRDSYQVIFTNNLNKTIKLLTSLTIILTIPTIIASLFGMNVVLPLSDQSPASFGVILLIILTVSLLTLLVFAYKRWL